MEPEARSMHQIPTVTTSWTELLGKVESTHGNELVLAVETKFRLKLSDATVTRYQHLLRVGKAIAILVLPDSEMRIRSVSGKNVLQSEGLVKFLQAFND